MKPHVLTHQGNGNAAPRVLGPVNHGGPLREIRGMADKAQTPDHHISQPGPFQHQGHIVEDIGREIGNGALTGNIAEEGDLLQNFLGNGFVAPAEDHVGLNAQAQQLLGRVLSRFGLQFSAARD